MSAEFTEPITKGIARFQRARDSMREDTSIGNVAKQWTEMNQAKEEWAAATDLLNEIECALDDFTTTDGNLDVHNADQLTGFLDKVSEYL